MRYLGAGVISEIEEISLKAYDEIFEFDKNNEVHIFLYEQGILVNDSENEYELALYNYESKIVKSLSLDLILLTTRQCNLRCIYCYENFTNKHITNSVYDNILKLIKNRIKNNLCNKVSIGLFGGEPFLPFNAVIKFLKQAKELCDNANIPFSVNATTNFTLVTLDKLKILTDLNCNFYQVTLDGLSELHNKNRPTVSGDGSFDTIVKNLIDAKNSDYDFEITLRTNFNIKTTEKVSEFYKYIKENLDDPRFSVFFHPIKPLGGKNDTNMDFLDEKDENDEVVKVSKILNSLGLLNRNVQTSALPFSGVCYASQHNGFVIDHNGNILKCTVMLDDDLNRIGCLNDDGELELDETKHSKWTSKQSKFYNQCSRCRVFPICFGKRCVVDAIYNIRGVDCDKEIIIKGIESVLELMN